MKNVSPNRLSHFTLPPHRDKNERKFYDEFSFVSEDSEKKLRNEKLLRVLKELGARRVASQRLARKLLRNFSSVVCDPLAHGSFATVSVGVAEQFTIFKTMIFLPAAEEVLA